MHYDWSVCSPLVCKQDDIYGEDIYGGVSEPTKTDAHASNGTLVQSHQVRSDLAVSSIHDWLRQLLFCLVRRTLSNWSKPLGEAVWAYRGNFRV